jgi:hypothetical protein
LQRVRDPREKGRIWNDIILNLQTSTSASLGLKDRTKTSIQQKCDALLQKYRNIKDTIMNTGEEAIQHDWKFYNDMEEYLKDDPSITAPITSDSIHGVKHKAQRNDYKDNEVQMNPKRKKSHNEKNMEELQTFIKEQTETIIKTIKGQYVHTSEIQQKQHEEQMNIFKKFLEKF